MGEHLLAKREGGTETARGRCLSVREWWSDGSRRTRLLRAGLLPGGCTSGVVRSAGPDSLETCRVYSEYVKPPGTQPFIERDMTKDVEISYECSEYEEQRITMILVDRVHSGRSIVQDARECALRSG